MVPGVKQKRHPLQRRQSAEVFRARHAPAAVHDERVQFADPRLERLGAAVEMRAEVSLSGNGLRAEKLRE